MMEKVEFNNSKGRKLVGVLHVPNEKTSKIVIIAHGFCSNKDRERLVQVADLYSENNISALRFDFSGSGESNDGEITVGNQVDDLKSAINYVKSLGYQDIGIQGESLGGLIAVKCYSEAIKTMVLWAPVTEGENKLKEFLTQEKLSQEELDKKGYIIKFKDNREFKIPLKYFEERLGFNREQLLNRVKCPVLILHGDRDDSVPLKDSKSALKYLEKGELKIIKGASHILDARYDTLELSLEWFKKYL